ncbi:MAG: hypothetical protein K0R13_2172 [Propionibacteriaceae bacterium]|jgi:hypothetical protein|nr:hypothetical protein [Propionibacteriaceae bacterium]
MTATPSICAGLQPLRSQQTQPAVRHRRQPVDPIKGVVRRTVILRIAEKVKRSSHPARCPARRLRSKRTRH